MEGNFLTQLLSSSLIFLSIGFSITLILPRLRFHIRNKLDDLLTTKRMSSKEYASFTYYLKLVGFMDAVAFIFLLGGFLVLLIPLGISTHFVHFYELVSVLIVLIRMIHAAYCAVNEALAYSKISSSILKRLTT